MTVRGMMTHGGGIRTIRTDGASETMKKILVLLSLTLLVLFPNVVSADCLDLGNFTSWVREDEHTILFYNGDIPIARLNIFDCEIYPSSKTRLIKSYMCDDDKIVIDGKTCSIITVQALY